MAYQGLEINGTIQKVHRTVYVVKENDPQLFSPDIIALTRIEIGRGNGHTSLEIFGEFGPEYRGRKIEAILSYDKPADGLGRFTQKISIDGKVEIDQEVVKRI